MTAEAVKELASLPPVDTRARSGGRRDPGAADDGRDAAVRTAPRSRGADRRADPAARGAGEPGAEAEARGTKPGSRGACRGGARAARSRRAEEPAARRQRRGAGRGSDRTRRVHRTNGRAGGELEMATDTAKVLDTLGKMTVLELVELKKAIEEEWGVTAAAPVAVAAGAAPVAGGDGAAASRGADRVRRRAHGRRRQEDPGDQGRPRHHRPRPEGGEGPRRLGSRSRSRRASPRRRPTRSRPSSRRPAPPSR